MGQSKQAAHARSAKVKPLHATLARRALLRLDSMAAPDPHSMGVPRPQFPRLCPACLPRYPLQTILRQVLGSLARKSLQFAPLPSSSGESRIILVRHPPIPWWDGSLKLVNNVAPLLHLPDLAPN